MPLIRGALFTLEPAVYSRHLVALRSRVAAVA